jgi:tryptophanyl-tRNA synthetase
MFADSKDALLTLNVSLK